MIEKYQLHSETVEPNINKKIPKIAKSTCRQLNSNSGYEICTVETTGEQWLAQQFWKSLIFTVCYMKWIACQYVAF